MLPSPIEPPIRQTWAIRGARSGCSRSSSAMFVSGPIGAMTTGSGMLAQDPRDQVDRTLRAALRPATVRQHRVPDARLAVDLGRPDDAPEERAGGALGDRHVARAVDVEEPERVRRAVADVGVAADGRDREQVDLRSRHREPDREGVVEAGVAVDDQRQRVLHGPDRRGPRHGGRRVERWGATASAPRGCRPHLALLVRLAGRGRSTDAPDDAGDDDDRHHVRDALQDLRCDVDAEDRQQRLGRVGEAEDERRKERPDRVPRRRRSSRPGR